MLFIPSRFLICADRFNRNTCGCWVILSKRHCHAVIVLPHAYRDEPTRVRLAVAPGATRDTANKAEPTLRNRLSSRVHNSIHSIQSVYSSTPYGVLYPSVQYCTRLLVPVSMPVLRTCSRICDLVPYQDQDSNLTTTHSTCLCQLYTLPPVTRADSLRYARFGKARFPSPR